MNIFGRHRLRHLAAGVAFAALASSVLIGCGRRAPAPAAVSSNQNSASPSAPAPADATPTTYIGYRNQRFGFTFDLPSDFVGGPPPEDGDGLRWTSPDGSASVTAFGETNAFFGESAASALNDCKRALTSGGGHMTYSALKSNEYVCTGYTGDGAVHYEYGLVGTTNLYEISWSYPRNDKSRWDAAVRRSVSSFKPGEL